MSEVSYLVAMLVMGLVFAWPGSQIARRKGHSPWVGVALAGILGLLGLFILMAMAPNRRAVAQRISEEAEVAQGTTHRLQSSLKGPDRSLTDPWERDVYG